MQPSSHFISDASWNRLKDLVNGLLLGFRYMYRTLKKKVFNHQSIKCNEGEIQFFCVFNKQYGIATSKNLNQNLRAKAGARVWLTLQWTIWDHCDLVLFLFHSWQLNMILGVSKICGFLATCSMFDTKGKILAFCLFELFLAVKSWFSKEQPGYHSLKSHGKASSLCGVTCGYSHRWRLHLDHILIYSTFPEGTVLISKSIGSFASQGWSRSDPVTVPSVQIWAAVLQRALVAWVLNIRQLHPLGINASLLKAQPSSHPTSPAFSEQQQRTLQHPGRMWKMDGLVVLQHDFPRGLLSVLGACGCAAVQHSRNLVLHGGCSWQYCRKDYTVIDLPPSPALFPSSKAKFAFARLNNCYFLLSIKIKAIYKFREGERERLVSFDHACVTYTVNFVVLCQFLSDTGQDNCRGNSRWKLNCSMKWFWFSVVDEVV